MAKKLKERELVQRCLKNDRKAQKELYERYGPLMKMVCIRYLYQKALAEEVMNRGFYKVFRNLKDYRHTGSFEGWIRRIFVNTSIENYRKEQRRGNSVEVEDVEGELKIDSTSFQKFGYDELMKIVQQLPLGYKTVFNMYVIEGYSHKEIAEQLGVTESTSKTQLHKARLLLQKSVLELDEYSSGRK